MKMTMSQIEAAKYNGWANYQTWNVALWINNTESIYNDAVRYSRIHRNPTYFFFVENMLDAAWGDLTPDNVSWTDPTLDEDALDLMIRELGE